MELEKLKKDYDILSKKYRLPSFRELNEEFEIEKITDRDTELVLKNVRRCVIEKIAAITRFFELILNPTEANLLVLSLLKDINLETKKKIETLYKEFSVMELASLNLDLDYNEKEEAKFIANANKDWKRLKTDLKSISISLGKSWNVKDKSFREYLG